MRFWFVGPSSYTDSVTERSKSIPCRILGLDYGRKRIGVALADDEARIAEPHTTFERINRNEDMRRLREFSTTTQKSDTLFPGHPGSLITNCEQQSITSDIMFEIRSI